VNSRSALVLPLRRLPHLGNWKRATARTPDEQSRPKPSGAGHVPARNRETISAYSSPSPERVDEPKPLTSLADRSVERRHILRRSAEGLGLGGVEVREGPATATPDRSLERKPAKWPCHSHLERSTAGEENEQTRCQLPSQLNPEEESPQGGGADQQPGGRRQPRGGGSATRAPSDPADGGAIGDLHPEAVESSRRPGPGSPKPPPRQRSPSRQPFRPWPRRSDQLSMGSPTPQGRQKC